MKNTKKTLGYNENIDDYTAKMFHTHTFLGLAAIPFTPFTQYEFIKDSNFSNLSIAVGVLWCVFFWVLLIIGLVVRRLSKRLEKHPKTARWCLDLINTSIAGYLAWSSWHKSIGATNPKVGFISGWWNSLVALAVLNTISRWYLKIVAYGTVVFCMFFKTFADTERLRVLFTLFEVMIYFMLSNFLSYRDSKKKFLEKQKLYEETQIFKEILDLTTDGILIYGLREGLMYRNWEKKKYKWWNEDQPINGNLKKIKIDVKNSNGNLTTEPIILDTQAETEMREPDLWEFLSKAVESLDEQLSKGIFNEQQASTIASITGKYEHIEEGHGRIISIKEGNNGDGFLEIRIMPLYFREKPALALIFHDITERSRISILEDNNNYKNRLLASVSHELRTPLNASINFIQAAIEDPKLPENIRDSLLRPSLASNRLLLFLINDILDFSQMAANKLRLIYEKSDVKKTVEECLNLIRLQAKSKGLSLDVEYQIETSNSQIYTDHHRLKQIILNLLSNAIKFTLEGGIKLRVRMLPHPKYSKMLQVEVEDTGIGISEEDQEKLFKAFEKIDLGARISINSNGVGLGLVISSNLVQMLGSSEPGQSINVTSTLNEGSVFSFSIVDKEDADKPALISEDQRANYTPLMNEFSDGADLIKTRLLRSVETFEKLSDLRSLSNPLKALRTPRDEKCKCSKVLVVDDDVFNITALKLILDKLGFVSDSAYNGEQAIKKILQRQETLCSPNCQQYKLVFMDCSMPILDGFETTKRLRAMMSTGVLPNIPIIGCTAFVQVQEKQRALSSGMDTCCAKPLDRDKINGIINEFMIEESFL